MACAGKWFASELQADTDAKTAIHQLLTAAAREFTQNDLPAGCMISLAGTHVPPALSCVRDAMAGHRRAAQSAVAARIQRGVDEGDVPKDPMSMRWPHSTARCPRDGGSRPRWSVSRTPAGDRRARDAGLAADTAVSTQLDFKCGWEHRRYGGAPATKPLECRSDLPHVIGAFTPNYRRRRERHTRFADKVAVISGASKDIGAGIPKRLATEGAMEPGR